MSVVVLRPDQAEILRDGHRFRVCACGRRWGKTTLALQAAVEAARAGLLVWWVAPTYGLSFYPWRWLKKALAAEWMEKKERPRFILLPGGGCIHVLSADDPNTLRGVGVDFIVVDEAAFVAEEAWMAVLRPSLSDTGGCALLISTPRGQNWFWRMYLRGQESKDWASWRYPTEANPLVPQSDMDEARDLLPEAIFRQEYLAEFVEGVGVVFRNVREMAQPGRAGPKDGCSYVAGVDFGRSQDFTVVAVVNATENRMEAMSRFSEVGWQLQRGRIAGVCRKWRCERVVVELNSMGETNAELLRREHGLPIEGFWTTMQSKPALIEGLAAAIEDERLALLDDPVLLGELEGFTFSITRTHRIRYHAPPGLHDDTVMALSLAWRAASGGLGARLTLGWVD